jgi:uroporphyrinogen-III synthase
VSAPLAGQRVVVTRALHQAGELSAALAALGAEVALLPLLEIVPPRDGRALERAASELPLYDWLVFTSANAVEAFLPLAGGALPARLAVAAVGPATAAALAGWEIEPRLVAGQSDAEGLVAALAPHVTRRRRVLLPQAADARPALMEGLMAAGAEAVTVTAYEKRRPAEAESRARELFAHGPLGWVTFTSPRIVGEFWKVLELLELVGDPPLESLRAASIGPVTSAELHRRGIAPAAQAESPGAEELAQAIAAAA